MTQKKLTTAVILALLCSLISLSAMAQGTTSRVTGTVTDQSGAAVPGATVTLTNTGTTVAFTTTTSADGLYVFESVQVGAYTVTVQKDGFKKFVSSANSVSLSRPTTLDVKLEIGAVTDVVQVEGSAELVQTSSSGNFGNTVEQRALETLPIVGTRGRNPLSFINFQPGVVVGSNTGGGVHVHGARDRAFNFTLDGIDINESSAGGSNFTPLRTNPDSLQEFQVVTGNFTAENGRSSGAQVYLTTRSGTNEFHGGLFEFYQTPRFLANEYENNVNGVRRGQFVQHIFGGSLGGPIYFPRLGEGGSPIYNGKNKTFFFTNLQLLRTYQGIGVTRTVYTQSARQGLFRYVAGGQNAPAGATGASVDAAGAVVSGLNIGTYNIGQRDPGCVTRPAACGLDPTVQALINQMPLPNNFFAGDGLNTAGYSFVAPQRERQYDFTAKVDHTIGNNQTIYVRYSQGEQNTVGDNANAGLQVFPNTPNVVDTFRDPKNLAVNHRWAPTGSITNEFVVGFNRFAFSFDNGDSAFSTRPPFTFNLIANPFSNTGPVYNARKLRTTQIVDNLSFQRGPHTIRTGVNLRFQQHLDDRSSVAGLATTLAANFGTGTNIVDPATFGLTSLTGINVANDRPRLQSMINDLLGRVGTVSQAFVAAGDQYGPPGTRFLFDARYPEYDFYGQDTWKIRPNLTLDYGLRWEVKVSPRAGGNEVVLRPDRPVRVGEQPRNDVKWVPGELFDADYNNLAPTLGLAWDPFGDGKTSVRANYRLAYDRMNTFVLSSSIFQSAPGATLGVINTAFGQGGGRLREGLPVISPPAGITPLTLRQPASYGIGTITVTDPDMRSPKTNQWGLSIQRDLGQSIVLDLNYIGRRGVGLYSGYDVNQVDIFARDPRFNQTFLDAFNAVRAVLPATGTALPATFSNPLLNQLLQFDSRRGATESGAQAFARLFESAIRLGSVAGVASAIGTRLQGGTPVHVLGGFNPFFFQPYPQFGTVNVLDSNDVSTYHAFEAQIKRRFQRGIGLQLSYTLAKSLDTRSFDPAFT
ncbi:MAG: carboxypeptidase regulatory-like domain-containing protein, partial [Blastocatellia bacterium]